MSIILTVRQRRRSDSEKEGKAPEGRRKAKSRSHLNSYCSQLSLLQHFCLHLLPPSIQKHCSSAPETTAVSQRACLEAGSLTKEGVYWLWMWEERETGLLYYTFKDFLSIMALETLIIESPECCGGEKVSEQTLEAEDRSSLSVGSCNCWCWCC